MKKFCVFSLTAMLIAVMLISCNGNTKVKTVELKSQNDSINYAFGVLNGAGLREEYMIPEKEEKDAVKALISEMDRSFNSKEVDMYELGKKVGLLFNIQEEDGFMGETDIDFNTEKAKLGIESELKGEAAMSVQQAQEYIQNIMFQIQMQKMMSSQGAQNPYGSNDSTMEDIIIDEQ